MIDTKALRQKILDMAIKGKLVPQNPDDEPASVLLERIRAEKQQLIKEGKIKKDKNDSIIYKGDDNRYYEKVGSEVKDITEAIDLGCPRNWTFVRLRDLIELISGRDLLPAQYNSDKIGIPYITGASNLLNERIIINRWTDTPSVVSHKGDLLITCKGTIGEMVFNNIGDVHIARQIMSIRCIGVNSLFIMLVLKSYVSQLQSGAKSFIPGISRDDILKLPFIMPPLAEQARIVNRVEELFKQIDAIEQNQADIDTLYDEFRKRTLTLAIQGKLVPQDPNDEPASVLLERIRAEKKAKLGKKYVDSYIYKGDDNCYYEHIAGREQDELVEVPFDIPDNWAWSRIDGVAFLQSGKPFEELESGTPYVKVSDMNLSENNIEITTSQHYCKATSRDIIPASSIIFPKRGGAISTNKKRKVLSFYCCIDLNTMCMTPFLSQMLEYLFSWFLTIDLGMMHDGTSVPQINNVDIYPLLVPIPPLADQKRIVAKINEIFTML